jgi:hypothetical protein
MKNSEDKKLILIQLNELNIDLLKMYIKIRPRLFKNFEGIIDRFYETSSELEYENLEPWIQWVSVYTGEKYAQHRVFRLGDCINNNTKQIFEEIEENGYYVGAIAPMNAENRLKNPKYFIPDPWTKTTTDGSFLSNQISDAITQVVNDNSMGRIKTKSLIVLMLSILVCFSFKDIVNISKLILRSKQKWIKAIIFDLIIHKIHLRCLKNNNPDFSSIFLNAGAHIQHHYLSNSIYQNSIKNPGWYINQNCDAMLDLLIEYDRIIGEYLSLSNYSIIIATGLSQKIAQDTVYYYRLKDPQKFINTFDIEYSNISQAMTRDFTISFESRKSLEYGLNILKKLEYSDQESSEKLFEIIEDKGDSIFLSLTVKREITSFAKIKFKDLEIKLIDFVVFVALKNGEHSDLGYVFFDNNIKNEFKNKDFIGEINLVIKNYFGISLKTS